MNRRAVIISAVIFMFALSLHIFPTGNTASPVENTLSEIPLRWKGWEGKLMQFDEDVVNKLGVTEYVLREYRKADRRVLLYIGYYGIQKEGAQIHSPKHCLPGSGWFKVSEAVNTLDINDVGRLRVVEAVYQKGEEKEVFVYFYKVGDGFITNEYVLKLSMVMNSLRQRRNDAAFVRFSSPVHGSLDEAMGAVDDFIEDLLPLLMEHLPK